MVTGGSDLSHADLATVTRYSMTGEVEYLASLNQGRYYHACSKFIRADGGEV